MTRIKAAARGSARSLAAIRGAPEKSARAARREKERERARPAARKRRLSPPPRFLYSAATKREREVWMAPQHKEKQMLYRG